MADVLDDIDRRMLAELQVDGRMSVRTLAERVRVSRANAYARLDRLAAAGVIVGYTVIVDPVKAGLATSAYVSLSIQQSSWRRLRERLKGIEEVRHMALVGGDFDVMLLVRAADNAALRRVVLDQLPAIPEVIASRTSLIFEDHENR
ncbi:Lrp/AsnC family transcriptional regulator [Pseudonocardia sp. TRM90224]|uniref:Lrp/AsnC family transcriptional regulator n=1 Tax=Pseudonocardia sp. TRM90224 TaxID=2812678 RepID=UPI001E4FACBB|nr:Lrp/AsnC family transcriptional regulator [Pseudonocardia sp. TRM90224]